MTANRPPVDALRKALEASRKGNWHYSAGMNDIYTDAQDVGKDYIVGGENDDRFSVLAHNNMPAILAYIEQLEELCEDAANSLEGFDYRSKSDDAMIARLRAVSEGGE